MRRRRPWAPSHDHDFGPFVDVGVVTRVDAELALDLERAHEATSR